MKHSKVVQNRFIPFKGFIAINLFGIIFTRDKSKLNDYIYNHEAIHTKQLLESGIIFFYIIYLIEWLIKLIIYKSQAYKHLSFEVEAYNNMYNLNYLTSRKKYAWLKYILNNDV